MRRQPGVSVGTQEIIRWNVVEEALSEPQACAGTPTATPQHQRPQSGLFSRLCFTATSDGDCVSSSSIRARIYIAYGCGTLDDAGCAASIRDMSVMADVGRTTPKGDIGLRRHDGTALDSGPGRQDGRGGPTSCNGHLQVVLAAPQPMRNCSGSGHLVPMHAACPGGLLPLQGPLW